VISAGLLVYFKALLRKPFKIIGGEAWYAKKDMEKVLDDYNEAIRKTAGKGGKLYLNRRTANAFALKRRLDPNRKGYTPFCCDCIPEWPQLREELGELRAPAMEVEAGQVKQVLEEKDALAARLRRSPDLLDALLMSFTYSEPS
jgi:hypothetical protein